MTFASVHIEVLGQGNPLVLFHGWGFDSRIWYGLLPYLSSRYRLYLVDLPGFGLTPMMSWDSFQSSLLSQLPSTFAILGWSMGGLFATKMAIEQAPRITHLINVSSSPHFIKQKQWPGIDRKTFEMFYQALSDNPDEVLQTFIALQGGEYVSREGDVPIPSGLSFGLDVLLGWDLRTSLQHCVLPVLYIFGRQDAIVPYRLMTVMQTIYPLFHYQLFSQSAHAPFLSEPIACVRLLEEFLS